MANDLGLKAKMGFQVGNEYYRMTEYQQKLLTWQIVASKLVDEPLANWRFYSDSELLDELDLHRDREGRALLDLPKIYSDAGNLAPWIVESYKALTLGGIDSSCVVVENDKGDVDEAQTEQLRMWLDALNPGGFAGMMDEVVEGGALFGTSFVALRRKPKELTTIEAVAKDAMMVFPVISSDTNEADMMLTYVEYENEQGRKVQEVEHYLPGEVQVYRNQQLYPELSGPTGTKRLTLVAAPFKTERGAYYGKSALHGLIETLVQIAGAIGASYLAFRTQAGGIYTISTDDDISKDIAAMGGPAGSKAGLRRVLDPDYPTVIVGRNTSVSMAQGNVMAAAQPLLATLQEFLAMRCPLYSWHRLGANASGEAIKQTYRLLEAELKQIRQNLATLISRISMVLGDMYKSPITGRVAFYAPEPFPPDTDTLVTRAILLFDKGVVPARYVAEVAGVDDHELVSEHLDMADAEAESGESAEESPADLARRLFLEA